MLPLEGGLAYAQGGYIKLRVWHHCTLHTGLSLARKVLLIHLVIYSLMLH